MTHGQNPILLLLEVSRSTETAPLLSRKGSGLRGRRRSPCRQTNSATTAADRRRQSASPFTRTVEKHTHGRGWFPGPASGSHWESLRSPNAAQSSSSGSGQKEKEVLTLTFELCP